MTVPVGLATVLCLPDTPHKTRAWFLTQADKDLALERVEKAGKAAPVPLTFAKIKRILGRWSMTAHLFPQTERQQLTCAFFEQDGIFLSSVTWFVPPIKDLIASYSN
jgi:hypothetical protein